MIYAITVFAIILGVLLDQYTKYLASTHLINSPVIIIDGVFQLRYLENRGAAFGLMQNQQLFFLFTATIALLIMAVVYIRLPKQNRFLPLRICLASIAAGAIGNMIDRIRLEYVVDFFYLEIINFPIFNVADIFATVATFVLAILLLFYYKNEDIDIIFQTLSLRQNRNQE